MSDPMGRSMSDFDAEALRKRLSAAVATRRGDRSLRETSAEAGLSFSTLARLERGDGYPDLESFARICVWTGIDPAWLLLGSDWSKLGEQWNSTLLEGVERVEAQLQTLRAALTQPPQTEEMG